MLLLHNFLKVILGILQIKMRLFNLMLNLNLFPRLSGESLTLPSFDSAYISHRFDKGLCSEAGHSSSSHTWKSHSSPSYSINRDRLVNKYFENDMLLKPTK
jgi:hypothetical protein